MKNKMMRTMLGMGGAVVMLLSSIDVYAAPKTMADGTVFDAEYYAEAKMDSFELGDEDITCLALVYVVDGDSDGPITDPDDSGDPEDNTVDVVKEMSSDTGEMSPDTGDTTPIALYAGLFTGAVALMAVLAVKRRKNSR